MKKLKQNRRIRLPKQKCFKFSAELRKCVALNNVCWQTVPHHHQFIKKHKQHNNKCDIIMRTMCSKGQKGRDGTNNCP